MCVDMCMAMRMDMYIDMCIDMCVDICMDMDMRMDMRMDMYVGMCIDMCVDVRMDMCTDMRMDMYIDVCIDMCTDMYMRYACQHVYGRVDTTSRTVPLHSHAYTHGTHAHPCLHAHACTRPPTHPCTRAPVRPCTHACTCVRARYVAYGRYTRAWTDVLKNSTAESDAAACAHLAGIAIPEIRACYDGHAATAPHCTGAAPRRTEPKQKVHGTAGGEGTRLQIAAMRKTMGASPNGGVPKM